MAGVSQGVRSLWPHVQIIPVNIPVVSRSPGLVVRDETILVAPAGGTLEWFAADGSRVPRGEPILRIAPGDDAPALHDELARVRSEIQMLYANLPGGSPDAADARVFAAEQGVEYRVQAWREALQEGRSPHPGFIDGLVRLWDERRALAAERTEWYSLYEGLKEEEEVLEELLSRRAEVVRAHRPGTVLFGVPAGIRRLARGDLHALTPGQLLAALEGYTPGSTPPSGAPVSAGQPLARLVSGWDAQMIVLAPAEAVAAGAVKEGATVTLVARRYESADAGQWGAGPGGLGGAGDRNLLAPNRFRGEVSMKAKVASIGPEDSATGAQTVLLDVLSGLPELVDEGFIYAAVDWGTVSGAGVPKQALLGDEPYSVLVRTPRGGVLRSIYPVWEDEEYVIAEGIEPGERVIVDPHLLGWITWRFPTRGE